VVIGGLSANDPKRTATEAQAGRLNRALLHKAANNDLSDASPGVAIRNAAKTIAIAADSLR